MYYTLYPKPYALILLLLALTILPNLALAQDITSGLMGHWKFDEGSGTTAADSSGNNNTGTLVNSPTWTLAPSNGGDGKIGQALDFDGVDDFVRGPVISVGTPLDMTGKSWTMSAWIQWDGLSYARGIVTFNDSQNHVSGLQNHNSANGGRHRFNVYTGTNSTLSAICVSPLPTGNTWNHLVGTWDGTNSRLYINGSLCTTSSNSASDYNFAGDTFTIGALRDNNLSSVWGGLIDDVRIYNRVLTASDIQALYSLGSGLPDTTPPTVSITAPSSGATVSGSSVAISANASDNVGIAGVQFKLDGSNLQSEDTSSPYSISWNTTIITNGFHTLTATARDVAGNTTTSSGITITVSNAPDTTPPTTSTNLQATTISSSQINLSWTASTDNVGVTGYRVERCQGSGCINFVQIATPSTNSYNDTGLTANTSHSYRVRATDAAGNPPGYSSVASATTQNPLSATNILYVDNTIGVAFCNTYFASTRSCGSGNLQAYSDLNSIESLLQPGTMVYIREGTYTHTDDNREYLVISTSGTVNTPITIQNYGMEQVIFMGRGYTQAEPLGLTNEKLLDIQANFIYIKGLEFTNSNRWGLYVGGNNNKIENSISHNNWGPGFLINGNNNIFSNLEAHHNRHSSGIIIWQSNGRTAHDNTIENSISYRNGYDATDTKVPPVTGDSAGGGNSDGIGGFKDCADAASVGDNLCKRNIIQGNIVWQNADGGFDFSFNDSLVIDNISFANGYPGVGQVGYKVLRTVNNFNFVRNISYHDLGNGYELRVTNGTFLHNIAIGNTGSGFSNIDPSTQASKNNLATLNAGTDILGLCSNCSYNWAEDGSAGPTFSGDPQLENANPLQDANGNIVVTFPVGLTIAEKVSYIKNAFRNAFSLQSTSGARNTGTPVSYINPQTGQTVVIPYQETAPDIGAYEYTGEGTPPPTLVGDLNLDNTVNGADWSLMSAVWFTSDATADLNADGIVNSIDFSLMNANWGRVI